MWGAYNTGGVVYSLKMLGLGDKYKTYFYVTQENTTDVVVKGVPTLEDLGVGPLMEIEHQAPWELITLRAHAYYNEELGEFAKPEPPPVVPIL